MNDIPDTFWAYLAGIIDGEGCILLQKFKSAAKVKSNNALGIQFKPNVQITMCDPDTIGFIADTLGVNIYSRTIKSGRVAHRVAWNNTKAHLLLEKIKPFLRGKKPEAELLLLYGNTIAPGRGRYFKPGDFEAAERIRRKLSALKHTINI